MLKDAIKLLHIIIPGLNYYKFLRLKKSFLEEKGFTLLEVLLVLLILGMLSTISYSIMKTSLKVYNVQGSYILSHQQAQLAIEYMIDDLKQAQNISTGGDWIEFDGYYKGDAPELMKYKTYYSGGELALGLEVKSTLPIINNITNIDFIKEGNLLIIDLYYIDRLDRIHNLYSIVRPGVVN